MVVSVDCERLARGSANVATEWNKKQKDPLSKLGQLITDISDISNKGEGERQRSGNVGRLSHCLHGGLWIGVAHA